MKIRFDAIYGDKQINEFMHACDVFEKGKQLADYKPFTVILSFEKGRENPNDENIMKIFDGFIQVTSKTYNLVFFAITIIDGKPTNRFKPYIKKDVQSITTGYDWGMFNKLLETIGYEVEHTQFMQVTDAKLVL